MPESPESESRDSTPHEISLAVWDVASPVVTGQLAKMKIGAKCSAGCPLTGQEIEIRNESEAAAGSGPLGPTLWPGTSGLYWTELSFTAPAVEGTISWNVILRASELELPHAPASSRFRFITVPPPEHSVIVKVIDKNTGEPVQNVEVRLGLYRGSTEEYGLAKVNLPKGAYELVVCKAGYDAPAKTVEVTADVTLQIELELAPEPEQEYWMG